MGGVFFERWKKDSKTKKRGESKKERKGEMSRAEREKQKKIQEKSGKKGRAGWWEAGGGGEGESYLSKQDVKTYKKLHNKTFVPGDS